MHYKYPRTYHLDFSEGLQNDDKRLEDFSCFYGKDIAITIKMDGENTSLYRDGLHARSLSSAHHPSRTVIKSLHATIKNDIPEGWRICGENMYAKHSIHYTDLESYFYVFNVWDENNICLPLGETMRFCSSLGLTHVSVVNIFREVNRVKGVKHFKLIEHVYNTVVSKGHEGIVVRNIDRFAYEDFSSNVAKAVRKNHITSGTHWSKEWIPNLLKS